MSRTTTGTTASTPALGVLRAAGVTHTVRSYAHDPHSELSYGLEAAVALGADPAQVLKTLVADVDGTLVLAVVPVSGRLDLKALAGALGGKRAVLAERSAAERATGYVAGGIAPLGHRRRLTVVVDESVLAHETVLVSAGRRGMDVELAPRDLVTLAEARTATIGRP